MRSSSEAGYSDHHLQCIKRQRMNSCVASLAWLENEGYTSRSLQIKDKQTGKMKMIILNTETCQEVILAQ